VLSDRELDAQSARFESATAAEVIEWAVDTFGRQLCISASMTDAVLIDLASRQVPEIEVIFVDTGYHFRETLETADRVAGRYPIRLRVASASTAPDGLWQRDQDACCAARKVRPLEDALRGYSAWLSGVRRADSADRATTPILSRDRRGLIKVNPLATWTDEMVDAYIAEHDVPVNPLVDQGYPSIGCWPCTSRVAQGAGARSGRWAGTNKTECGLHL
jgi:phosphoadenosine phosphosulfate reductase